MLVAAAGQGRTTNCCEVSIQSVNRSPCIQSWLCFRVASDLHIMCSVLFRQGAAATYYWMVPRGEQVGHVVRVSGWQSVVLCIQSNDDTFIDSTQDTSRIHGSFPLVLSQVHFLTLNFYVLFLVRLILGLFYLFSTWLLISKHSGSLHTFILCSDLCISPTCLQGFCLLKFWMFY